MSLKNPTKIRISSIGLKKFADLKNTKITFNDSITEIYGENKSGKSTIANAIAYAITGYDFWRKKYDPLGDNKLTEISMEMEYNSVPMVLDRYVELKGTKRKTIFPMKKEISDIDDELYSAILNPEYILNAENKAVREILLKMPLGNNFFDEEELSDEERGFYSEMESLLKCKFTSTIRERYEAATIVLEEKEKEFKELPLLSEFDAMIEAYKKTLEFIDSKKVIDKIEKLISNVEKQKILSEKRREALKIKIESIKSYQKFMFKYMMDEFNKELVFSKIDDEMSITYAGKPIKQTSSSEKVLAGLDIVNAIQKIVNYDIPVIIDNAESIQHALIKNENLFEVYENINQIILFTVSSTPLGVYNDISKTLEIVEDGTIMARTRVAMLPEVKFINF